MSLQKHQYLLISEYMLTSSYRIILVVCYAILPNEQALVNFA